jgi:hypothetical protein
LRKSEYADGNIKKALIKNYQQTWKMGTIWVGNFYYKCFVKFIFSTRNSMTLHVNKKDVKW